MHSISAHSFRRGLLAALGTLLGLSSLLSFPCRVVAQDIDVWIDPGHGGKDPGAPGFLADGVHNEKRLAFQVSSILQSRLAEIGYFALLTRNSDIFWSLADRALIANGTAANDDSIAATAQRLVVIHMNSNKSAQPYGTTTYYQTIKVPPKRKDAYRADSSFAQVVHEWLINPGSTLAFLGCDSNRTCRPGDWQVTRETSIPSAYIEVCFISNQCQQGKIDQQGNQALVANGIALGINHAIAPLAQQPRPSRPYPSAAQDAPRSPSTIGMTGVWPTAIERTQSYSEGFEEAAFPPTGWTATTSGLAVPFRWFRSTDPLYLRTGVGAATIFGESPGAIDEWLISPRVFLGPNDRGLSFWWSGNRRWASAVNLECLVRPVGSSTWTSTWSLLSEPAGEEFEYRERVVNLTPWLGDSIQFAFHAAGSSGADVMVDDVTVGNFTTTTTPTNDLCTSATPLPAGTFSVAGMTCYASNNLDPSRPDSLSCVPEPLTGSDVFFTLNAQAGDTLDATVFASWSPALYLVDGCGPSPTCLAAAGQYEPQEVGGASFTHVFTTGGTYYLGIDGRAGECGPFQLTGSFHGPTSGVALPGNLARSLSLAAYPNPARGIVTFRGALPESRGAPGTITILDVSGRRLARVPITTIGSFEVRWDGRDDSGVALSAGVYFAQLSAGGTAAKRTLILSH